MDVTDSPGGLREGDEGFLFALAHLAELDSLSRKRRLRVEPREEILRARDRILAERSPRDRAILSERLLGLLDKAERLGLKMMHPGHPDYPLRLGTLATPPFFLFARGDATVLDRPLVAVVGAREAGRESLLEVTTLAKNLSEAGLVVVSGLARGVDAAAHRGALEAMCPTVAVVGTGLDRVYPPENAALAREIESSGGLILSEYPPGFGPDGWHFPHRNRIVAGLSLAVIAGAHRRRSGTYITARIALEEGRELLVFDRGARGWEREGPALLEGEGARRANSALEVMESILS
ncbi:MAG: DNA-processing protein DprA [Leptospirillia bacterium]